MNFYDIAMCPLEKFLLSDIRKEVVSVAYGSVLEIGIGTGANLRYYNFAKISKFTGVDVKLSSEIQNKAYKKHKKFQLIESNAECLPFADNSFDVVVATLVLCSVKDLDKSIREIKRVMKYDGKYIFIEHISPNKKTLANLFKHLNIFWTKISNGCNLNRRTYTAIKRNGLEILWTKNKSNGVFCYGMATKKNKLNST